MLYENLPKTLRTGQRTVCIAVFVAARAKIHYNGPAACSLDRIGLGKELQRATRAGHEYLLPQSSLPGAPPAPKPKGNGRAQNTKAAKEERAAKAAAKREELTKKRAEAEARMGRPRKSRLDKGTKQGPHTKK